MKDSEAICVIPSICAAAVEEIPGCDTLFEEFRALSDPAAVLPDLHLPPEDRPEEIEEEKTEEEETPPDDLVTRNALKVIALCGEAAEKINHAAKKDPVSELAHLGSTALILASAAEGAALIVYGQTRLFRDRGSAKHLNSEARSASEDASRSLKKTAADAFSRLTTL